MPGKGQTHAAIVNRLLDLLQGAALIIVLTQFEGHVTNDLQHWGFQVIARTPKNGRDGTTAENITEEQPAASRLSRSVTGQHGARQVGSEAPCSVYFLAHLSRPYTN